MFCKNCGSAIQEGMKFCSNCGTPAEMPEPMEEEGTVSMFGAAAPQPAAAEPEQPVYAQPEQPVYTSPAPQQPVYTQPEPRAQQPVYTQPTYTQPAAAPAEGEITPSNCLTWGILGLAFACIPYVNFLGIIFSILAKKKVAAFTATHAEVSQQVNVGSRLAKAGLIVGCIFTGLFAIIIIAIIAAAGA